MSRKISSPDKNTILSDFKFLFDPEYNHLSGNEIIGKCKDFKKVYRKIGFLKDCEIKATHDLCNNSKVCRFSNSGPFDSNSVCLMKLHNQICHTRVQGFKLLKCPNYSNCNFAISLDLLLTTDEWEKWINAKLKNETNKNNLSQTEIESLRKKLTEESNLFLIFFLF